MATLVSLATASPEFLSAIEELISTALIKQDGLYYSIHRVVQEATNYDGIEDLQTSFDTASKLTNEQFPKRDKSLSLYDVWPQCQEYISHGVHLSRKFADYAKAGVLKGSPAFVELLSNCGWYILHLLLRIFLR